MYLKAGYFVPWPNINKFIFITETSFNLILGSHRNISWTLNVNHFGCQLNVIWALCSAMKRWRVSLFAQIVSAITSHHCLNCRQREKRPQNWLCVWALCVPQTADRQERPSATHVPTAPLTAPIYCVRFVHYGLWQARFITPLWHG